MRDGAGDGYVAALPGIDAALPLPARLAVFRYRHVAGDDEQGCFAAPGVDAALATLLFAGSDIYLELAGVQGTGKKGGPGLVFNTKGPACCGR